MAMRRPDGGGRPLFRPRFLEPHGPGMTTTCLRGAGNKPGLEGSSSGAAQAKETPHHHAEAATQGEEIGPPARLPTPAQTLPRSLPPRRTPPPCRSTQTPRSTRGDPRPAPPTPLTPPSKGWHRIVSGPELLPACLGPTPPPERETGRGGTTTTSCPRKYKAEVTGLTPPLPGDGTGLCRPLQNSYLRVSA